MTPVVAALDGSDYDAIDVIVASAGTTSAAADFSAGQIVGVFVPTIDNATITFEASLDGITFRSVRDSTGAAVTIAASTGAIYLDAPASLKDAGPYVRVVLGAAQNGGARTLTFLVRAVR